MTTRDAGICGPPRVEVEIDVAALHLARVYSGDTSRQACARWAARIRQWARRYPDRITRMPRAGRRGRYDLVELQQVAEELAAGR